MKQYLKTLLQTPRYYLVPILAMIWNDLVYFGGRLLAKERTHYDWSVTIDHKIPLLSWTVSIYFGCFLFWGIVYLYLASRDRRTAAQFFLADFLGKLLCLFFFIVFPTTMQRPEITGSGIWNDVMRFLYTSDEANNLFPSIHCMVSWYCWIGMRKQTETPRWCRNASLIFAVLVCISTLTTRQHVIADVFGGILIAEGSDRTAEAVLTYLGARRQVRISKKLDMTAQKE